LNTATDFAEPQKIDAKTVQRPTELRYSTPVFIALLAGD
jgi:hypothetical protein